MTSAPSLPQTLAFSPTEALMWGLEGDPSLRFRIVGVLELDRVPDQTVLVDRVERLTRTVPRLRHRVVSRPAPGLRPHWELDPGFDLDNHLSVLALPDGAGERDLLAVAEAERQEEFAPGRSPWRMTLVTGLADGRAAVVLAMNHVITDGVGGVRMGGVLLDLYAEGPTAEELGEMPPVPAARNRGRRERLQAALTQELRELSAVPGSAARLMSGVRDPLGSTRSVVEAGNAARRFVSLPPAASPLPRTWSPLDRYAALDVPVAGLKAAGRAAGGSFNDAYLAGLVGGFRRYHDQRGLTLPSVTITMPVNVRSEASTQAGGNEMVLKIYSVPADVRDPAARIVGIRALSQQEQSAESHLVSAAISQTLGRLPGPLMRRALGRLADGLDLPTTNVPGVPVPLFLAGARITRVLPFLNRGRSPLTAALMTYDGTAFIALTVDPLAIPDPETLVDCLKAEFEDVLALAGDVRAASPA